LGVGHFKNCLYLCCIIFSVDRDSFAKLVREVASPDVGKMGIEILSFTIKDIEDKVQYLDSLGKTQTAKVKRDADIGVAEAHRDAGIRVCKLVSYYVGVC
jgi:flotillin